jgi:Amt family ammonium transporter
VNICQPHLGKTVAILFAACVALLAIPSAGRATESSGTAVAAAPLAAGRAADSGVSAVPAQMANGAEPDSELARAVAHNRLSINMVWTLVAGFLVMFMQAGFALIETGMCRAKNAAHVMAMNFLIYPLGMLGFWICGFALMFGGYGLNATAIGWQAPLGHGLALLNSEHGITLGGKFFGLWGGKGFCLNPSVFDTAIFCFFLFQVVFMDTAATIPTGAMAERWRFKNFILYGFWIGMLPYALFGNWVWGGGWLAQLGANFGLGHGHVDFAGSSVVHLCGGMIALVGACVLGPRYGKYAPDGSPRPIPGHNVVYVILGTFILAFGWFGFNAGSSLSGTEPRIAIVAVNTMLASAAAVVASCLVLYWKIGKPEPSLLCNGMLAGLVAITAPCAFVTPCAAVLIGAVAGTIVILSVLLFDTKFRIDDPVGAISVHGLCGAWGALSVGLFANGGYGAGWNGVHKLFKDGVVQVLCNDGAAATLAKYKALLAAGWHDQGITGAFGKLFGAPCNDWSQLGAQLTGTLTCILFVGAFALLWFHLAKRITPMRTNVEEELQGLDIPEMGAEAYPDYQLTDKSSPL